jgi:thiosulfate/3-mercaptopyruvate sulfurtransferase
MFVVRRVAQMISEEHGTCLSPRGPDRHKSRLAFSTSALVSAAALARHVLAESPACTVLDCSWHMPAAKRDAHADFLRARIPGAKRFDIDAPGLADPTSHLPHMLAPEHIFEKAVHTLVPGSENPVFLYSTNGFVGSARVWWMLRAFGFEHCRVLNGGFDAWRQEGFPIESGPPLAAEETRTKLPFIPNLNLELVWTMSQVLDNLKSSVPRIVLDARSQGRFDGFDPEPRPGLPSGHIPGSYCLPFGDCMKSDTGPPFLKSKQELEALLKSRGISESPSAGYAVTCGSGVTAAILALALHEVGFDTVPCYDGSWTEYADPCHQNPIRNESNNT